MDAWLLDPATRQFRHLPGMPAAVHLKFTSMAWANDGRLVMLAQSGGPGGDRDLVAIWKPGQRQIAVRDLLGQQKVTNSAPGSCPELSARGRHRCTCRRTASCRISSLARLCAMGGHAVDYVSRRPLRRVGRVLLAVTVVQGLCSCGSASSYGAAIGHGPTAEDAVASYLQACGSDYTIAKGPYDADKATTPYASYAQMVEYTLNVKNNGEGALAFLWVGRRTARSSWQTLGQPGTGP